MFLEQAIEMAENQAARLEVFINANDGVYQDNLTAFYSKPDEARIAYKIVANLQLHKATQDHPNV